MEELDQKEYPILREFIHGVEHSARCERLRKRIRALKKHRTLPGSSNFVFFREIMDVVHSREGDASVHWVLKNKIEAA